MREKEERKREKRKMETEQERGRERGERGRLSSSRLFSRQKQFLSRGDARREEREKEVLLATE